uniref:Uncharacterized protein n=1 Tax=Jatropha curcas TaxID=180498 RepID=E2CXJ7_JATCU|nr:hypothetical protein [Jatropha curcas]
MRSEAEKDSYKSNKALRKTMWDWEQELFVEAPSDFALVPFARLKAIFGGAPSPPTGDAGKEDAKLPAFKLVI